jgi:hypothetical protein
MYEIFAPLDDKEPLPRELLNERRRYRGLGRRELAGCLWLPALAALLYVAGLTNMSPTVGLAVIVLLLVGLAVFAVSGERGRLK